MEIQYSVVQEECSRGPFGVLQIEKVGCVYVCILVLAIASYPSIMLYMVVCVTAYCREVTRLLCAYTVATLATVLYVLTK